MVQLNKSFKTKKEVRGLERNQIQLQIPKC